MSQAISSPSHSTAIIPANQSSGSVSIAQLCLTITLIVSALLLAAYFAPPEWSAVPDIFHTELSFHLALAATTASFIVLTLLASCPLANCPLDCLIGHETNLSNSIPLVATTPPNHPLASDPRQLTLPPSTEATPTTPAKKTRHKYKTPPPAFRISTPLSFNSNPTARDSVIIFTSPGKRQPAVPVAVTFPPLNDSPDLAIPEPFNSEEKLNNAATYKQFLREFENRAPWITTTTNHPILTGWFIDRRILTPENLLATAEMLDRMTDKTSRWFGLLTVPFKIKEYIQKTFETLSFDQIKRILTFKIFDKLLLKSDFSAITFKNILIAKKPSQEKLLSVLSLLTLSRPIYQNIRAWFGPTCRDLASSSSNTIRPHQPKKTKLLPAPQRLPLETSAIR